MDLDVAVIDCPVLIVWEKTPGKHVLIKQKATYKEAVQYCYSRKDPMLLEVYTLETHEEECYTFWRKRAEYRFGAIVEKSKKVAA